MPLKIRPLVAEDRADWGQMWGDYLSFYDTDVAPEIYETTFARLINPANRVQNALVAERDGEAVALSITFITHIIGARKMSVICKIFTPKTPCVGGVLAGL